MENLNAEQIISELRKNDSCYAEDIKAIRNAIALINSQEQRIEAYRQELGDVRVALAEANNDRKQLTEENERLIQVGFDTADYAVDKIREARADTVQKMQERLKSEIAKYFLPTLQLQANVFIDQIAKEMLEGENV